MKATIKNQRHIKRSQMKDNIVQESEIQQQMCFQGTQTLENSNFR